MKEFSKPILPLLFLTPLVSAYVGGLVLDGAGVSAAEGEN